MAFAGAVWGDDRFSDRIGGACFIWPERGVHVSLPGRFPAIFTKGGPIPAGGADRTNGEGNHTYLRFWRAVQGADRPARPGGGGLFRDPPLYRKPGGDPDHGPGGDYFYRRAGQRLSPWLSRRSREILELGIPVLGICYGMQLLCFMCGGRVGPCETREYGVVEAWLEDSCPLFLGNPGPVPVLMSHTDQVLELPEGFSPRPIPGTALWRPLPRRTGNFGASSSIRRWSKPGRAGDPAPVPIRDLRLPGRLQHGKLFRVLPG